MAEVIEWANGNGYTVCLTIEEAFELEALIRRQLGIYRTTHRTDDKIEFELEIK